MLSEYEAEFSKLYPSFKMKEPIIEHEKGGKILRIEYTWKQYDIPRKGTLFFTAIDTQRLQFDPFRSTTLKYQDYDIDWIKQYFLVNLPALRALEAGLRALPEYA